LKKRFSNIILNGESVSPKDISEKLSEMKPNAAEWEMELFGFLNEWFSDSKFIVAKTSGSTGEPKIIELPKSLMIKSAERTIEYFELQKNNRLLLTLPCRYIAGKMMAVRAIVGGMNLATIDPTTDFEFLQQEKFDFGALVPNQASKILEDQSGKEKLENISNLLIGGSAISENLEKQFGQLKNRTVITYGMTETASHIAIRELSGKRKSEIYCCLPGISVDSDDRGCLKIHVPKLQNPIQTNDLVQIESETSFKIIGRADSIIISGGIKYQPEVIEKKLEGIVNRRYLISSLPDEKLGEKLVLVIEGEPFGLKHLQKRLKELLTAFEQPRMIFFLNKFPETKSGKVKRTEIKSLL